MGSVNAWRWRAVIGEFGERRHLSPVFVSQDLTMVTTRRRQTVVLERDRIFEPG